MEQEMRFIWLNFYILASKEILSLLFASEIEEGLLNLALISSKALFSYGFRWSVVVIYYDLFLFLPLLYFLSSSSSANKKSIFSLTRLGRSRSNLSSIFVAFFTWFYFERNIFSVVLTRFPRAMLFLLKQLLKSFRCWGLFFSFIYDFLNMVKFSLPFFFSLPE